MSIEIIKGDAAIRGVINSISVRANTYKTAVSSAIISAAQHYRAHNDYTLLQEAMDTVFEVNYRDYTAVVDFVKSLTWAGLNMENRGRRQHYSIIGDLVDGMGQKPSDVTVKDWSEKVKRAKENIITRQGLFNNFIDGKEIPMKNPDWTTGMPKEEKQQGVVYGGDLFKWHDDVKWLRNDGTGGATTGSSNAAPRTLSKEATDKVAYDLEERLLKSANKPAVPVLIHMIDRFESESSIIATDEELANLEASFNLFMRKIKIRSDIAKEAAAAKAAETANAGQATENA